jgi:putative transposase
MERPQGYKSNPALHLEPCGFQCLWPTPGPGNLTTQTKWKNRRVTIRTLRYTNSMSRLRRLQVTGKTFFITCNLLAVRTQLTEVDFEALASAVVRVRSRRGFLFTRYVFLPDHWHALIIPLEGDTLPNLMDAVKVASTLGINRSRRAKGPVWQRRYFDRIVREVREYHKTVEYMHLNPVRRGLASRPEDWLWSSIHSYGGPGPVRLAVDRILLPSDERTRL